MATIEIGTYTELQAAIADWLIDHNLNGREKAFIQLAESRFNRDIRVEEMVVVYDTASTVAGEKYVSKPTGFLEARTLKCDGVLLNKVTPQEIAEYVQTSGAPTMYAIVGDYFHLYPTPEGVSSLEIIYFSRLTPLSDENPNNWLLIKYPDVYLYGALLEAAIFIQDDANTSKYNTMYANALEGLRGSNERATFSGSYMQISVDPRIII